MRNNAIKYMMCYQYQWSADMVDVEFISFVDGLYKFKIKHYTDDERDPVQYKTVFVQVFDEAK